LPLGYYRAAIADGVPCSSSLRDVSKRRELAALQGLRLHRRQLRSRCPLAGNHPNKHAPISQAHSHKEVLFWYLPPEPPGLAGRRRRENSKDVPRYPIFSCLGDHKDPHSLSEDFSGSWVSDPAIAAYICKSRLLLINSQRAYDHFLKQVTSLDSKR